MDRFEKIYKRVKGIEKFSDLQNTTFNTEDGKILFKLLFSLMDNDDKLKNDLETLLKITKSDLGLDERDKIQSYYKDMFRKQLNYLKDMRYILDYKIYFDTGRHKPFGNEISIKQSRKTYGGNIDSVEKFITKKLHDNRFSKSQVVFDKFTDTEEFKIQLNNFDINKLDKKKLHVLEIDNIKDNYGNSYTLFIYVHLNTIWFDSLDEVDNITLDNYNKVFRVEGYYIF